MEYPTCSECARLLVRSHEATKVWAEVHKALVESALAHNTETFSHALDKCHLALALCNEAGQDFLEHLRVAHGQVHDICEIPRFP